MTKQEFLAMSLPYGLSILVKSDAHSTNGYRERLNDLNYSKFCIRLEDKPILHLLSDLTKEIDHKGEKFVPIERLRDELVLEWCGIFDESVDFITDFWDEKGLKEKILVLPFLFIKYFIEWHFDIAGLIEKGEAIDVNTLPENPYK